jgi:hypothetical protein
MALYEFEPQVIPATTEFAGIADTAPEEEQSPLDSFKKGLHEMVVGLEDNGISSLPNLVAIRQELREKRKALMRRSSQIDSMLSEDTSEIWSEFNDLQQKLVHVYHQLKWLEGYISDRL